MNYHNITHDDLMNGEGSRVVLWVSGCNHYCPECQNSQTWNPNSGILFDEKAKKELYMSLGREYTDGITFSGGDPLNKNNLEGILELCKEIKEKYPNKTIWLYSGYTYKEIQEDTIDEDMKKRREILSYCNVFCDGRFIKELADKSYPWVGSTNQKVIRLR